MADSMIDPVFEEIQRLVRIVGVERFHEIRQQIWDTRAPTLLREAWPDGALLPTEPFPLMSLWHEVLAALRLEVTH